MPLAGSSDEAFAKLPAGALEELLKPENKDKLVAILTYHVVDGQAKASDVVKLTSAKTVNGEPLKVSAMGSNVMVNDANLVKADILCSNGVIHVIRYGATTREQMTPQTPFDI